MDQAIRNKLRNVVTQCRRLLEDAVAQVLQGQFGIYATGKKDEVHVEDESRMTNLVAEEDRACRRDLLAHFEHIQALGYKPKDALAQLVREIAFTHLNRLCAYKMMEARGVVLNGRPFREAVSRGLKSQGFLFYLAEHPEDETRYGSGHQDVAYRHFLDCLGGTLSEEIGVLFSPNDPANRLYPPQRVLDDVLDLINTGGIKPDENELQEAWPTIWCADETIGWVYQYFTPKELRDQARKESAAPRNSYELAFRNQFFTPRYVVEFLTDNTLGRIWYEMRKGQTRLKDQCRYMVRRPNEVFLAEGQEPPEEGQQAADDLSQEELLKLPAFIPYRPKKDPREIRILDPACGSGHFLLYCFDLLETVYEDAYDDPDLGPALKTDYPTRGDLRRAVPGMILARNLHGIDIDRRATQIAALALWLRCQRAYQEQDIKKDRPRISRSNIVCAEPMPGEKQLLEDFLTTLQQDRLETLIRKVLQVPQETRVRATQSMVDSLCELVRVVWEKMRLAGEAGSLLKIEEELQEAIRVGQEEWEEKQPLFRVTEFGLTEHPKESYLRFVPGEGVSFWQQAERLVMSALYDFATFAGNGHQLQRRLFADDAVRGFAFVDLCRQRFDVALMNPPFGEISRPSKKYVEQSYPRTKNDLYAAFVERGLSLLRPAGRLGAITSRSGFFLSSFQKWRQEILLQATRPVVCADLGQGVLDTAMVETAAYCLEVDSTQGHKALFFRLLQSDDRAVCLANVLNRLRAGEYCRVTYAVDANSFEQVPGAPFAYWITDRIRRLFIEQQSLENTGFLARRTNGTTNDGRWIRTWWEPSPQWIGRSKGWVPHAKGGEFSPFYSDLHLVIAWDDASQTYPGYTGTVHRPDLRPASLQFFFKRGITWSRRTQKGLSLRALPEDAIFGDKGPAIFGEFDDFYPILALTNSSPFHALVRLQMAFGSYEAGVLQRTPIPPYGLLTRTEVGTLASECVRLKRDVDTANEISHVFQLPALLQVSGATLAERAEAWNARVIGAEQQLAEYKRRIDNIVYELYGIDEEERQLLEHGFGDSTAERSEEGVDIDDDESEDESLSFDRRYVTAALVSYTVGCVFGRWDMRIATGNDKSLPLPDVFAPLPVSSGAMLQGLNGLPSIEAPPDYPLEIDWDGIVVDDPDHSDDIGRRMRDVLEAIWSEQADTTEREICETLGVEGLRDYFRKPGNGGFWMDHVSRYSKSRRKAPVYWLLQSSKRNYALWIYYHRFDKDILFKALVNYVEPKIRLEENRLESLRGQKGAGGKATKKLDRDIEKQESLLSELRDFEDKLRRAANLHLEPDLNDGVVLNIAPLWELVPWREAKDYWEELLEGKYEWSSIGKQLREKGIVK